MPRKGDDACRSFFICLDQPLKSRSPETGLVAYAEHVRVGIACGREPELHAARDAKVRSVIPDDIKVRRQFSDLIVLRDYYLFVCFERADRIDYRRYHRTPVIHDVQKLVAAEPFAVTGCLQYDGDLSFFRLYERTPGALYSEDAEYLLEPVGGSEPVYVFVHLIHKDPEFSADAFLTAAAGCQYLMDEVHIHSLAFYCFRQLVCAVNDIFRPLTHSRETGHTHGDICIVRYDRLSFTRPLQRHAA